MKNVSFCVDFRECIKHYIALSYFVMNQLSDSKLGCNKAVTHKVTGSSSSWIQDNFDDEVKKTDVVMQLLLVSCYVGRKF